MALDTSDYGSDLNYSFEKLRNKGELVITYEGKEHLFLLDIKEVIPTDENGKPTISKQDINRKRGINYSITIDSIEGSLIPISTSCVGGNVYTIVERLAQELFLDIESHYEDSDISNGVSLFIDLARERAMGNLEQVA